MAFHSKGHLYLRIALEHFRLSISCRFLLDSGLGIDCGTNQVSDLNPATVVSLGFVYFRIYIHENKIM